MDTRLAKPEDFETIKTVNSIRTRIINNIKVVDFIEDLVHASITRRSVVSFYISKDLWRFLPLMLKEKNWYNIADQYLSDK